MYKFNEIGALHVELSSNCQASCPMCARNHHGGIENPLLKVADIDLVSFKQMCPPTMLQQLHTITMCGNFGDPILNKDLIPIILYIRESSIHTRVDVHTNGGARPVSWWKQLALAMPDNHMVQFGIDGLEDTHHLYRVGTSFKKIIDNAKAYISAGGKARWNFITFKHNEHQLEDCRQLAKNLGFDSFYEKQTSRFIGNPWFDVLDRDGNVTHKLEGPTEQKLIFIDRKTVENYKEVISKAKISCEVEELKSVYIDALGYLWPCCFVGAVPYIHATPEQLVYNYQQDSMATFNTMLDRFGGMEQFNLRNRSVEEIVDSEAWQTVWDDIFANNKLHVCARVCGKFPEPVISQCRDQFLDLDNFNE
jgi:MoaA/NifB/PqqE/SkfB family radical SAM enzyme